MPRPSRSGLSRKPVIRRQAATRRRKETARQRERNFSTRGPCYYWMCIPLSFFDDTRLSNITTRKGRSRFWLRKTGSMCIATSGNSAEEIKETRSKISRTRKADLCLLDYKVQELVSFRGQERELKESRETKEKCNRWKNPNKMSYVLPSYILTTIKLF